MREDRLQHDLIMWFGHSWPEYRKLLIEINNNPKNKAHGSYRKSMGMIKSASDLIMVQPKSGTIAAIELKAHGSIHPKNHIENQIAWGELIIEQGGFFIMSSDLPTVKEFISLIIKKEYLSVLDIQFEQLLFVKNQFNNKTIKF